MMYELPYLPFPSKPSPLLFLLMSCQPEKVFPLQKGKKEPPPKPHLIHIAEETYF